MIIEVTPTVAIAFLGFCIVVAGKVWSLSSKVEGAASKEALSAAERELLREVDRRISDKTKESQETHRELASKSALTRLTGEFFDLEKEVRLELKELRESMDAKFQKTHDAHLAILDLLTKISYSTQQISKIETESKGLSEVVNKLALQVAQLRGVAHHG
jgi:hypothetical protein